MVKVLSKLRRPVKILLKILAVCLASLLVLEIGVRVLTPMNHFSFIPNTYDPTTGIRQVPGARGFLSCPEYDCQLQISSQGLRDREFSHTRQAGTSRILCLGDSFTNGFGVPAAQTFSKVLETNLGDGSSPLPPGQWEVLNAGVAATGTAQQLAYFEHEGFRYQPNHVVLAFSPNDFVDNAVSGLYTIAAGSDTSLTKHDAPRSRTLKLLRFTRYLPGYTTLFARSHLLNTIKMRFAARHHGNLAAASIGDQDQQSASAANVELAKALVTRLGRACAAHQCLLVVMIIPPLPDSGQVEHEVGNLVDYLHQTGIFCLDLREEFAALNRQGVVTNYPDDGHWNESGHLAAAAALTTFYRELFQIID